MSAIFTKLGQTMSPAAPKKPSANSSKKVLHEGLEIKLVPPKQPKIKPNK